MCGIVIASQRTASDFPFDKALNAIKHRGPDDNGYYFSTDRSVYLGQTRLSIIDLSEAGHQPMTDTSGRFVLSYNGELYNFQELRNELKSAHSDLTFKSNSDTEVVLEGFAREGTEFLAKMNGMFALGIHDRKLDTLTVLRDPVGIKPLYMTCQFDGFYFSSELKALLELKKLTRTLRTQSFADQLAYTYIPEPYTAYEEFTKMEPGVCKVFSRGKCISSQYLYGKLHEQIAIRGEADAIERLQNVFESSVKRQLVSDVPMSLFLSGGLDSSAIAHQCVNSGANIYSAYTISFSDQDLKLDQQGDDLKYARIIASKLGLDLRVIQPSSDALTTLVDVVPFLDDITSDPAVLNTYLICQAARSDGIKVLLSGQGADEYMGGYRRYIAEKNMRRLPRSTKGLFSLLNRCVENVEVSGRFNATARRVKRLLSAASMGERERLLSLYIWAKPDLIASLFHGDIKVDVGGDLLDMFERVGDLPIVDSMLKVDQHYDLMSLNLTYTDRMSMASGVEARVPYLDFELIQLMNSIPHQMKVKGGTQKYILKKAFEPYLPREVVHRSKAGFGLPIRSWFKNRTDLTDHYFGQQRIAQQGLYEPSMFGKICHEHYDKNIDHSYLLFSMLVQQMWFDLHQ